MDANVSSSGDSVPFFAVQQMARDAGAAYLLYVVIDRPPTKWLKVTVQCDDTAGQRIWEEQADSGRAWASARAITEGRQNALHKLREELNNRLGQPGLPQVALEPQPPSATVAQSPVVPAPDNEDSGEFIRLANGTPVRLLISESVSSKTAKPGDTVKLQVLDDVKVGDLVIIAGKAPASATIETANSAGRAWRPGNILLKLNSVALVNQQKNRYEPGAPPRARTQARGRRGRRLSSKARGLRCSLCRSRHCNMETKPFCAGEQCSERRSTGTSHCRERTERRPNPSLRNHAMGEPQSRSTTTYRPERWISGADR